MCNRPLFRLLLNDRYSWGISRILNQNSVNSEFVNRRPKNFRSPIFVLYVWFVFLLKKFNHPLISCLRFCSIKICFLYNTTKMSALSQIAVFICDFKFFIFCFFVFCPSFPKCSISGQTSDFRYFSAFPYSIPFSKVVFSPR